MRRNKYILYWILVLCLGFVATATAQDPFRRATDRLGQLGQRGGQRPQAGQADSIGHRTGFEDSITIRFRFLDTSRLRFFDSSITDFSKRYPAPWHYVNLGNTGNATRNLLFAPYMQAGWDHGFHAYDIYNFTVPETRLYNTTRPYAELNYVLGSQQEQIIRLMHTQNIRPNWNAAIEYRLINAPGLFQHQNTNHNNYRFSSWYQSKNKRYQNFIIVVGNKLQSGENGGIRTDQDYLGNTEEFSERFVIPTVLGQEELGARNFFNVNIPVGTFYTNATYLMRQQYDIGQKDSMVVNDTTVVPLFYPRLRLEHTISYNTYKYRFRDTQADSTGYDTVYNYKLPTAFDTVFLQDFWKILVNDFSLYQFPDAKNAQQFFKAGITLQNLQGILDSGRVTENYYNVMAHAEYRNKTRNQKWDIMANGQLYLNGLNAGDYNGYISLKRYVSKQLGFLELGFQNTNRSPSFNYNPLSTLYLDTVKDFSKENITNIFASLDIPQRNLTLSANYYLLSNYLYYFGYYKPEQFSTLFNVLNISLYKQFRLARNFHLRTWLVYQQRIGDGPVNLPALTNRNQLGYDGSFGFKNLTISLGLETRYFTPYKAPDYSPLTGQYSYQDTATIELNAPDIAAYMHFRIKSFTAYIRAENLNTFDFASGQFSNNNMPTRRYPYPGLQIRAGIYWSFVN